MRIRKMMDKDLTEVQKVDYLAWSDYAAKERGKKIELPKRPLALLRTYLGGDPEGCFVAVEKRRIAGYGVSRTFGELGYFGPLAVDPGFQGRGFGKRLVSECVEYLEGCGTEIIGLETMPQSSKNLELYTKFGFRTHGLTFRMKKSFDKNSGLKTKKPEKKGCKNLTIVIRDKYDKKFLGELRRVSAEVEPGVDFTKDFVLYEKHDIGKTVLLECDGNVIGFALCYTYSNPGAKHDLLRVRNLSIAPGYSENASLKCLLHGCEAVARESGKDGINIIFYSEYDGLLRDLKSSGFVIDGTLVRMSKSSYSAPNPGAYHASFWGG